MWNDSFIDRNLHIYIRMDMGIWKSFHFFLFIFVFIFGYFVSYYILYTTYIYIHIRKTSIWIRLRNITTLLISWNVTLCRSKRNGNEAAPICDKRKEKDAKYNQTTSHELFIRFCIELYMVFAFLKT